MNTQKTRRTLSAIAAVAVGAVLALGAGSTASAVSASTIDPSQTGTISIHKFKKPTTATGLPNDGRELSASDTASLEPLPGVTFSVQQIDPTVYNLTTNEGWTALKALTPNAAATAVKGHTTSITTIANGDAIATNLPLGVYLVTETVVPAGTTAGAPFLITVPMTDPIDSNTWMYNVHVYPKNAVINPGEKTVDDSTSLKVGDDVTWTITGEIPNVDVLDGYRIVDPLDARLTYKSTAVTLTNGTELLLGTDYTIATVPPASGAGTKVTVDFTEAGRIKLVANKTASVQIAIVTTINTVGDIPNQALIYPNEASFDIEPGEPGGPTPTEEPIVKYGNVTISKVSAADNSVTLAGATFQVFATENDARNGTNAITVEGVSSWTTGTNGQVTIPGLRQSAWYDNQVVTPSDTGFQYYWIAETKAPSGYELLAQPVRVTVGENDTIVDFTVENSPANGGFELPFTGSALSASLFYGGGAIVLLGAAVLAMRARRRVTELA
ncbi:SpaH/EbpB family LPXTG-anchored major pilin [Lysinibacter cavernae]|uniref:Fimbrial isopeptide formation D2 family protein n=1 Tax=Lysinibacter cavernae TaxID=1640652 RepID=A0A7X5R192_9MICO|nr:fimbrial isopeptide formation D2 family protein [Lysinibacter cavernae]